MNLSDLLKSEHILSFAAIKLDKCRITKERLLSDADIPSLYAVVMLLPYPKGESREIASFALIPDYHGYFADHLFPKLEKLDIFRNKYMKVFSDHSPIDERHAASISGLGVIGDNGLFISEKYGSFVFIGEIICSLNKKELEDEGIPVRSPAEIKGCTHCGACKRACPGGCITGDRSLCVSSLTQKKGILSDTERDIIRKSGYIWGCDRCALVCPMNSSVQPVTYNEYFSSNKQIRGYSDVEKMDDYTYSLYPFSWRKREVMERNKLISDTSEGDNS